MKSGELNFLEPSGPLQACNGTDFFFFLILCAVTLWTKLISTTTSNSVRIFQNIFVTNCSRLKQFRHRCHSEKQKRDLTAYQSHAAKFISSSSTLTITHHTFDFFRSTFLSPPAPRYPRHIFQTVIFRHFCCSVCAQTVWMLAGICREEGAAIVVEYDRLQWTVWLVFWVHKQPNSYATAQGRSCTASSVVSRLVGYKWNEIETIKPDAMLSWSTHSVMNSFRADNPVTPLVTTTDPTSVTIWNTSTNFGYQMHVLYCRLYKKVSL